MYKSIQQFNEEGIKNIEKIFMDFTQDMTKFAEMVEEITRNLVQLGLNMIAEELESYDEFLRKESYMRPEWYIVRQDTATLVTTLGTLHYHKTLFIKKTTKERAYLLDRIMGIAAHTRISEDAIAKILFETAESSYRKAGSTFCLSGEQISGESVMNKIHTLQFPKAAAPKEKKVVPYLYIDADEDHIALQHKSSGSKESDNENKHVFGKLVYVYEGIEPETLHGKRNRLKNPHYFSGVYEGKENEALWDEVYEYLKENYELESVKKIYLNADGGSWIKSGMKQLENTLHVLDEFHLKKYISTLSRYAKDDADDAKEELCRLICYGKKEDFKAYAEKLIGTDKEKGEKEINYILNNWNGAKIRLQKPDGVVGSSTEGHISHVLAERMSSRPMGWSLIGAAKMAKLRAWYYNGGDMLELVRYQKEIQPTAAGYEEGMSIGAKLNMTERRLAHAPSYGIGAKRGSLALQARKRMAIRSAVKGLYSL